MRRARGGILMNRNLLGAEDDAGAAEHRRDILL